ncbi:saccharopine dehydrogenase [Rhodoferax sp. TH121]|uniref:saccharopine dehydrogenase family protein n=1 Tax=Rhodoferax sp. TH121 TaxID=2022803 RepID=UPI000B96D627|nr:saccharopine dehydrogenase NADP-binding domain-containing protein [Rhodoferax sp. TH121]OYQ40825.1 saccharopine dehydrogenase [Rhodoferax sp. TH121]
MRVMVLGGYGNFGARICRALAADSSIELLVAGRYESRASAFAQALNQIHHRHAKGVAVDWQSAHFVQTLQAHGVELLLHTAGPFQGQNYVVAQACAEAGAHYIDLADGRRFVCDFAAALQAPFVAANRIAITGASTVPALSSAVVDFLSRGWSRIDSIDICIAPAQTAPRGVATLEAVLSYCGMPIPVWVGGRWQDRAGWADLQPVQFARLRPRLGAVCDIPDLALFPTHYGVRDRVEFRAALEVGLSQRAFAVLAWLRQRGVLKNPGSLARLLNAGAKLFDPLGSALGGMVVRVAGVNADGASVKRAWHISADNDHGPEIPCMAAILLARRLAAGETVEPGARACVGLHALEDFAPEFAKWGMVTDVVEEG